jgi:predicted ester cyclase
LKKYAAIIILTVTFCLVLRAQDLRAQTPAAATPPAQTPSTAGTPAVPASATVAPQSSPQSQASDSTSTATAEALARKYIELWNTGDKAAIKAFPSFVLHSHGGRVVVGSPTLDRVITAWRRSLPDLTFTVDDSMVQGDKAVIRVTLKGTYKEILFPEAAEPRSPPRLIRATGMLMFKIKDGKIQEIWQELDESSMKVQMGAQWKTRKELDPQPGTSKVPVQ